MKRFLFTGFLALALVPLAQAQPAPSFINNGTIITNIPPQIDATNFINNGIFEISLIYIATNALVPYDNSFSLSSTYAALSFSDVQNYTNRGTMTCDSGFLFNNEPSGSGTAKRSATFGNSNLGEITAGSIFSPIVTEGIFINGSAPELTISATNVVNTGTLDVGVNGLLTVDGVYLYLAKGLLNVEGLSTFSGILQGDLVFGESFNVGMFPIYWGLGDETNAIPAANFNLTNAFSSDHLVTNSLYQPRFVFVAPTNAAGYAYVNPFFVGTNGAVSSTIQVTIVGNANTNVAVNVRYGSLANPDLPFLIPVIQWASTTTNTFGVITTNTLYMADGFGQLTNFQMVTNGFSLNETVPQLIPYNYTFSPTFNFDGLEVGNTTYSPALIPSIAETNQYSAYAVNVQPVTFTPDPNLPGQTVSNVAGRIIINADQYLDLTRTMISGPNYLSLTSTNEFVGSTNAQIASPFMDINLGTTNGQMSISNLVAPYVPRLNGPIDCYSARWTNVTAGGGTNIYHVLFVSSDLAPTALPLVLNCALRSTNVLISDVLNVSSNLLINAESVTITSNSPSAPNLTGQINLFNPNITWTPSFPVLQNFTNWGTVSMSNTVYFLGARQIPYYSSNFTEPYQTFVNHGLISASGIFVWADYFEDSGSTQFVTNFNFNVTTNGPILFSSYGDISIEAGTANLLNGTLDVAFGGDIDVTGNYVTLSNTSLAAYGTLNLVVSNVLTDTGTNFGAISNLTNNIWVFADGMNLPLLPTNGGDLLGTTITNTGPASREVDILWAGQDRGPTVAGFQNNEAIGRLVLNGSNNISTFFFSGPGATNAIYIDQIVLENGATNRGSQNVNGQIVPYYTAVDANPGMTVYFADAIANGEDISEKLNGNLTASGGNVIWVPAYAGFFSGTNVTYPSGITYTLNRALVESPDIDSSGTGTNNAFTATPVFEGEDIKLSMYVTNTPARSVVVSWVALAESPLGVATNILYSSTSLLSANWVPVLTNFSTASVNQRVYYTNNAPGGGSYYYMVREDPPQP